MAVQKVGDKRLPQCFPSDGTDFARSIDFSNLACLVHAFAVTDKLNIGKQMAIWLMEQNVCDMPDK